MFIFVPETHWLSPGDWSFWPLTLKSSSNILFQLHRTRHHKNKRTYDIIYCDFMSCHPGIHRELHANSPVLLYNHPPLSHTCRRSTAARSWKCQTVTEVKSAAIPPAERRPAEYGLPVSSVLLYRFQFCISSFLMLTLNIGSSVQSESGGLHILHFAKWSPDLTQEDAGIKKCIPFTNKAEMYLWKFPEFISNTKY